MSPAKKQFGPYFSLSVLSKLVICFLLISLSRQTFAFRYTSSAPLLALHYLFSNFVAVAILYIPLALTFTFTFDAMTSWPSARSRSRTTSPNRHRGAGRSSRSSTSTHRPSQQTTSQPREGMSYRPSNDRPSRWQTPDRHVLAIINFQDLADLSARLDYAPNNADYLDAECRTHLGAIEEISLFTWCRHFDHHEITQITIRNLCHVISTRIRETWDIRIPGHTLELRGSYYLGDTVQIADELSIGESLEAWFPRWRSFQQTFLHPELLPQCPRRPFVWRLTCHRKVPGVILP